MTAIYNTATVCPFDQQDCAETAKNRLTLDPEITERFAKSRNFHELEYLWAKWHEQSGKLMRDDYEVYVNLMNKMAAGNNFSNAADYWKDDFEVDNFEEIIDNLWQTVKPLYDELHTYMRYKLISIYGNFHCTYAYIHNFFIIQTYTSHSILMRTTSNLKPNRYFIYLYLSVSYRYYP